MIEEILQFEIEDETDVQPINKPGRPTVVRNSVRGSDTALSIKCSPDITGRQPLAEAAHPQRPLSAGSHGSTTTNDSQTNNNPADETRILISRKEPSQHSNVAISEC